MLLNGSTQDRSRGLLINTILIYDISRADGPEMRKAQEEEIQDAKLLFFYPESTNIHIKRNLVGFSEGIVTFWDSFAITQDSKPKSDLFVADYEEQMFMIKQVEKDIWMGVIFRYEENDALNENENISSFSSFSEELLNNQDVQNRIYDRFYGYFHRFYGPFSTFFNEKRRFTGLFYNLFEAYIERFSNFYSFYGDEEVLCPSHFMLNGLPRFALRKSMFLLSNHLDIIL